MTIVAFLTKFAVLAARSIFFLHRPGKKSKHRLLLAPARNVSNANMGVTSAEESHMSSPDIRALVEWEDTEPTERQAHLGGD